MKTGHDLLALLPPHIQEQFEANMIEDAGNLSLLNDLHTSHYGFIDSSFSWSRSNEGSQYWIDIDNLWRDALESEINNLNFQSIYDKYPQYSIPKEKVIINSYPIY